MSCENAKKRQRRSSQPDGTMAEVEASGASAASSSDADGAVSCWLCLGEGNDDEPLVRDCSCRGSQGFAHFSCLVEYASHKSMRVSADKPGQAGPGHSFRRPWQNCPTCLQMHQGKLLTDLAVKFGAFVEERFPGDMYKRIYVLYHKMTHLSEEKVDATELLQVVKHIRA